MHYFFAIVCVCVQSWKIGKCKSMVLAEKKKQNAGDDEERKAPYRKPTTKEDQFAAWLVAYVKRNGDWMPHLEEVHLPCGSLAQLYAEYMQWCKTRDLDGASKDYITKLFHKYSGKRPINI